MDYLLLFFLVSFGGLVMVQAQSCTDPSGIQHCLQNLQTYEQSLNLFTDKEALETECRLFNKSMDCVDDYLVQCFHGPQREEFNTKMSNVRNAVRNLCSNPQLMEDLLYHKDCYKMVSDDWARCIKGIQSNNSLQDNCAVRDRVVKCGHESAVKHCSETASKSVCRMAASLMSMIVPPNACKTDGTELCSSGLSAQPTLLVLFAAIVLALKNFCKDV